MIIIRIRRKVLLFVTAVILTCSIGFNIFSYMENTRFRGRYESIVCIASQFGRFDSISFLISGISSADSDKNIEIFDIERGQVTKRVRTDTEIQELVEGYINGITGMYGKVKAFPDKGLIIKVPFDQPVKVESGWLNNYGIVSVDKAFILIPQGEKPYLLVLDEKGRPFFYNFEGSTDLLLGKLHFIGY